MANTITNMLEYNLPNTREEITMWALENIGETEDFATRCRGYARQHGKSRTRIDMDRMIIERWVNDVRLEHPDLYKGVPQYWHVSIYIGGVHVYDHGIL
jgi:hypothetical protein